MREGGLPLPLFSFSIFQNAKTLNISRGPTFNFIKQLKSGHSNFKDSEDIMTKLKSQALKNEILCTFLHTTVDT